MKASHFLLVSMALIIAIGAILSSCSANYHLRKAKAKDPSIFRDTVIVSVDTVWREIRKVDTVFRYNYTDTVIIRNRDSVVVKYYQSHSDSTIYLSADCPDCPEVTKVEHSKEIIKPNLNWKFYLVAGAFFLLIIGLIWKT